MRFVVYGPYDLQSSSGLISKKSNAKFWEEVENEVPGLSGACGCYVFRVLAGKGSTPLYVGKAEKQAFKTECFSADKMMKYNEGLATRKRGRPQLIFLAQVTQKRNDFRKPTTGERPFIQALESMLIGKAFEKNPDILNIQGTRKAQKLEVEGFLNTSQLARGGPAKVLRDTFRLPIHKQKLK